MSAVWSFRRWWLALPAIALLGAGGCPTSVGCGVSGSMPGGPRAFTADTWTCQASLQLAKGASIESPGAAKAELVAKKESTAIQVASLRNQLGQSEERGFGFAGKEESSRNGAMDRADPVNQELTKLTTESERLDSQIQTIDSIQLPPDAVVLKEGTWTMEGDQVIFRSVAPYTPGQKVVIPYVVRSAQGEVLKSGYLPVESVRVDQRP